jgi:hypothetical protein
MQTIKNVDNSKNLDKIIMNKMRGESLFSPLKYYPKHYDDIYSRFKLKGQQKYNFISSSPKQYSFNKESIMSNSSINNNQLFDKNIHNYTPVIQSNKYSMISKPNELEYIAGKDKNKITRQNIESFTIEKENMLKINSHNNTNANPDANLIKFSQNGKYIISSPYLNKSLSPKNYYYR